MASDRQTTARSSTSAEAREDALVEAVAAALVLGAPAAATASGVAHLLSGVDNGIVRGVTLIALSKPLPLRPAVRGTGGAVSEVLDLEPMYRANYIIQASRRVQRKVRGGMPVRTALSQERQFYDQHLGAQKNRIAKAKIINAAATRFGPTLGWYATLDSRTSLECRTANGKNFQVGEMPVIGYPGMVHVSCRCKAGAPHSTKQTVYMIKVA